MRCWRGRSVSRLKMARAEMDAIADMVVDLIKFHDVYKMREGMTLAALPSGCAVLPGLPRAPPRSQANVGGFRPLA